jgi:hypothetical protein
MSRAGAIARAAAYFDDGGFLADLKRRVAFPSTSQEPARAAALRAYLDDEIVPAFTPLGFICRILDNPLGPPALVAERIENPDFVTVLVYGHGDPSPARTRCGGRGSSLGGSSSRASASMAAAPPTTKASTASTLPPLPR